MSIILVLNAYDNNLIPDYLLIAIFSVANVQAAIHPIFYGFYNNKFSESYKMLWQKTLKKN